MSRIWHSLVVCCWLNIISRGFSQAVGWDRGLIWDSAKQGVGRTSATNLTHRIVGRCWSFTTCTFPQGCLLTCLPAEWGIQEKARENVQSEGHSLFITYSQEWYLIFFFFFCILITLMGRWLNKGVDTKRYGSSVCTSEAVYPTLKVEEGRLST